MEDCAGEVLGVGGNSRSKLLLLVVVQCSLEKCSLAGEKKRFTRSSAKEVHRLVRKNCQNDQHEQRELASHQELNVEAVQVAQGDEADLGDDVSQVTERRKQFGGDFKWPPAAYIITPQPLNREPTSPLQHASSCAMYGLICLSVFLNNGIL
ncbi:hypothetical protein VTO42DRAFT_4293 [Malbranchea cinnamomea]